VTTVAQDFSFHISYSFRNSFNNARQIMRNKSNMARTAASPSPWSTKNLDTREWVERRAFS
jgi:hypothetical protein